MTKPPRTQWRKAILEGLAAARKNLLPGLVLFVCGVILVVSYYQVDAVQAALGWIGEWKLRLGLIIPIFSTAFFGGVLPLLFRRVFLKESSAWSDYVFQTCFWAEKGLEVELLYNMQAELFGHGNHWQTVLPKVLVDQLVYVPLLALPCVVLGYLWKDCGFSVARTREALRQRGYWERSLPVLLSNWAVWIPAVAIIYCFPLPLQLPLMNITLSFWVMLLILLAGDSKTANSDGPIRGNAS